MSDSNYGDPDAYEAELEGFDLPEEALDAMLGAPSFETQMFNLVQDLWSEVSQMANVLYQVIQIVSENAHSPSVMADELQALLAPDPDDGEPEEGT